MPRSDSSWRCDVNGPGGMFDEEQHVDPLADHRVDAEQIAGQDPLGLRFEELAPGGPTASGSRIQPGAFEDVAHGTGRHADAGTGEFTADALIAPGRALACQAQHRFSNVVAGPGTTGTLARVSPPAGNQVTVPPQQCRRRHEETRPREARQQPRERGQQDPISVVEIGSVHLTAEHGDLVPERKDFDLLGPVTTPEQDHELRTRPRRR